MDAILRRFAPLWLAALAVAALAATGGVTALAQEAPPTGGLEIVSVEHDVGGTVSVSAAAPPEGISVTRVAAIVDGLPATVRAVDAPESTAAQIVIAIDTSGSMEGAPIASAQDAALRLIDRLDADDAVAIVGFSGTPTVLSDFTTNRAVTRNVLQTVTAGGETALYDAVSLAASMLEGGDVSTPHVLVLLSDGEDSSGADAPAREESLSAIAASGAVVHAFALGEQTDEAYLADLTSGTGGSLSQVATESALGPLFESLGSRLGAYYVIEVAVPPMATGEHRVELTAMLDGERVSRSSSFDVTNDGLLSLSVQPDDSDPELVAIDVTTAVPASLLRIEASIDDEPLTYTQGRVYVDAWAFDPGRHSVDVRAYVADSLATTATTSVQVEPLEPQFQVAVQGADTDTPTLTASARAQGPGPHTLRVLREGEEVGSSTDGEELRVPYDDGQDFRVEFLDADGEELASEELHAKTSLVSAPSMDLTWVFGAALVLLVAVVGWRLLRSRRRVTTQTKYRALRRISNPREVPQQPGKSGPVGTVRLISPDGSEQMVEIAQRPVTVGSATSCDLVVHGPGIQPIHARISARRNGEFQIHGLASGSGGQGGSNLGDWLVLHVGEAIALGDHQIVIGPPPDIDPTEAEARAESA